MIWCRNDLKVLVTVFEIRNFHLAGYFSGKAEESLNQNKRSKNHLHVFRVTVTYTHSVGFVYFVIWIVWSYSFLIPLMNFFFYMLPCFHQNLFHYHIKQIHMLDLPNQIRSKWILNPGQDWHEIWILDAINKSSKYSMHDSESFRCQIAKFNSWKLIVARWILINTILMQSHRTLSI